MVTCSPHQQNVAGFCCGAPMSTNIRGVEKFLQSPYQETRDVDIA